MYALPYLLVVGEYECTPTVVEESTSHYHSCMPLPYLLGSGGEYECTLPYLLGSGRVGVHGSGFAYKVHT